MTIKEWLTPDFFAFNVILITLLMNLTIYAVVSNFTVDFKMSEKLQSVIFSAMTATTLIYAIMVALGVMEIIPRYPYLYDNKYNFLLLGTGPEFGGNGPVLIAVLLGVATGCAVGILWGRIKTFRISMAVSAVACEAVIMAMTLLWIVNQT